MSRALSPLPGGHIAYMIVARHGLLVLAPELDQRLRANGSIEMTMKLGFRQTTQQLGMNDRHAVVHGSESDDAAPRFAIKRSERVSV